MKWGRNRARNRKRIKERKKLKKEEEKEREEKVGIIIMIWNGSYIFFPSFPNFFLSLPLNELLSIFLLFLSVLFLFYFLLSRVNALSIFLFLSRNPNDGTCVSYFMDSNFLLSLSFILSFLSHSEKNLPSKFTVIGFQTFEFFSFWEIEF